ncbi:response regulator [Mucilaginibacter terrae]|uniref:histidine kinase n=1 Tax=Mucilaginibacter terrae TaxID=1955052 RepID=A0ABU3H153_9SPHI|nr:response regulator [Mucilaginibacter terrae]MDT3405641.1 signal transduction histidine kinase/DNA-binding response OmpR family regulator/CHASE3 domain sensor protein [Mucilaginibacter terrae]
MFKLNFRAQVMIGFAVAIILVFALGIFSYKSIRQLEQNQEEVDHSQQLVTASRQTLQLLIDAETGTRGYVATGQTAFLDPYKATVTKLGLNLTKLEGLVENDPDQQENINNLITSANDKLVTMKNNIDMRDTKGLDYVVQSGMLLKGKEVMDQVRKLVADINDVEIRSLDISKKKTQQAADQTILATEVGSAVFLIIIIVLFFYIQKTFEQQKKAEEEVKNANAELGAVLAENEAQNWLLTGVGQLNEKMQGQQNEKELSENVLSEVCKYTNALSGTLYLYNENDEHLDLYSYYAFHDITALKPKIKLSEGWMGQVAQDQKAATIKGNLNDKLKLQTSIIDQELAEIMIVPFFFDKKLKGVMEVAFQKEVSDINRDYILAAAEDIGIAINTAQARTIMHDLFEETQQQAEELEAQQEEMRVTNEELLNKTEMLQASEEELRVQQEELRTINAELEEKASLLEEKNQAIEEARAAINLKVNELETTGKYKSEFLANMSHELRTPLNSILVLARILKDNKADNLNSDQIKYASVIFNAGNDLLTLINDILDLSKIESGKLEMQFEHIKVDSIVKDMELLFSEVADNKKINFTNNITGVQATIFTDKVRVEQVIKNLLSNAFKFTPEAGNISLKVSPGKKENTVAFAIKDSGIGIAPEKQRLIFEAFQQADGSTSRKYGGTGLGLSISRELASLLGGEITLTSQVGEGAEFTLTIPVTGTPTANEEEQHVPTVEEYKAKMPVSEPLKPASQAQILKPGRTTPLVVIVEDDHNFADILQDYARDHGYEALMLHEGGNAAEFIKDNMPDAVILDIMLPGKDGWQILKELKADSATKDIPVHLMSAGEAAANRVRKEGAISFMKKPINTETLDKLFNDMMSQSGIAFKQILLVEDHEAQSQALKDLMQRQGIAVDQAFTGEQAFNMLQQNDYQCVILDLNLPDESGLDLLDRVKAIDKFAELPVIVNTAMELDKTSVNRLMQYANAMVMKTNKSADRLIDEVNLFLHKVSSGPSPAEAPKAAAPSKGKESLKGKKSADC